MSHPNKITKYYWKPPDKIWRTNKNKSFRHKEKQYFKRYKDILRKSKDRGWFTW